MNEVSPVMLTGPNGPFPAQFEPPRSNRAIADSWRGLYGSDLFSSMLRHAAFQFPRNDAIGANISVFAEFFTVAGVSTPDRDPADISDP
jgi:hypothetical protein